MSSRRAVVGVMGVKRHPELVLQFSLSPDNISIPESERKLAMIQFAFSMHYPALSKDCMYCSEDLCILLLLVEPCSNSIFHASVSTLHCPICVNPLVT